MYILFIVLKNRPKGASLSLNENVQKRLIEKKIFTMLKKNEFLYSEIAKEKEYINRLLFPSYDINLILEPEEEKIQTKINIKMTKPFVRHTSILLIYINA